MKNNWWKALGVIIIIYTFIAGLGVPLNHGISGVNPSSGRTGDLMRIDLVGYNSHYLEGADSMRAWLRMDLENSVGVENFLVKAKNIEVIDERNAKVEFEIPSYLPTRDRVKDFSLIVDNQVDGASVYPQAVFITQDSIDPETANILYQSDEMAGLHNSWRFAFPYRTILYETIRNTYFHVALWFAMLFLFMRGIWFSVRYLRNGFDPLDDAKAMAFTAVGLLMGMLGLITGAIWAKYTWGEYWSNDVKQITTAIALLIYCAYFVLRDAFDDEERRGRISAVYAIFAFVALLALIYVVPRLTASLHPGNGGNPALGSDDLDNTMRMVFYPCIIGWCLIGGWMSNLLWRTRRVELKMMDED